MDVARFLVLPTHRSTLKSSSHIHVKLARIPSHLAIGQRIAEAAEGHLTYGRLLVACVARTRERHRSPPLLDFQPSSVPPSPPPRAPRAPSRPHEIHTRIRATPVWRRRRKRSCRLPLCRHFRSANHRRIVLSSKSILKRIGPNHMRLLSRSIVSTFIVDAHVCL